MPTPTQPDHTDLESERQHLNESRQQLTRMRERASSLDGSAAADWVSRQVLEHSLAERVRKLADDPSVPLFFGRITYDTDDRFYIGRRHISDAAGDPMVIDWRAPISLPFYRATATDALGLLTRRRYGFQSGELTAYEDEDLHRPEQHSALLEAEIEKPRVGPMRDIVATIQPEQDEIVRADATRSICVQGAPGTGKTAVGLHRVAYLLYAHREQLSRRGVLVIGPNDSFLRYIGDVLPALGEVTATQATIQGLVEARTPIRGTDSDAVATLKGDARMAEVLHNAVWSHLRAPTETLVVPRGAQRWRVPASDAAATAAALRERGLRYAAGRELLNQSLAHRVLLRMEAAGDSPDDRVQSAVARSAPVKAYAKAMWPEVKADRVLHALFSDPQMLAAAAEGILTEGEQRLLQWPKPPRSAGLARWSLADAVLLDELADILERTGSLAHIVVDEAQDLSAMMLRAVARRASTGAITVLGDLAQATTPWASRSWAEALGHLGKPEARVEELTKGFRVPGQVIEYAARLLPRIAPGLQPPTSVRRSHGELAFGPVADLTDVVARLLSRPGSIGVICTDESVPAHRATLTRWQVAVVGAAGSDENEFDAHLDLVPASLAKGLEYDHVVLLEPAGIVAAEADSQTGLRRLYVCLTRAVTSLQVLHDRPLPPELGPQRS